MICYKLGLASRQTRSGDVLNMCKTPYRRLKACWNKPTALNYTDVKIQNGSAHALRTGLQTAPQLTQLVLQLPDAVLIEAVDLMKTSSDHLLLLLPCFHSEG